MNKLICFLQKTNQRLGGVNYAHSYRIRLNLSVDTACVHTKIVSPKNVETKKWPSLAGHAVSATQTFSSVSIRVSNLDTRDFDFDTPKSAFSRVDFGISCVDPSTHEEFLSQY
jgi:hypothetical protein